MAGIETVDLSQGKALPAMGAASGIFGGGLDAAQQEVNNILKSEFVQASASGVSTEEVFRCISIWVVWMPLGARSKRP